ncbi:ABC transporter, periplasmic substrate-binding protein [Minicystis rosea]|nr:ABC transporter, periplasmic substrate-binding protein [Minicystis rosea]
MRVNIVFGLLLVLFVGYGALYFSHERPIHTAPVPALASASAAPSASASAPPIASASALPSASASAPPADAGPSKLFDRPLRVVALGWDLAAPAILANGGLDGAPSNDFTAAGLDVRVSTATSLNAIESALARGGADKDGADVAVLPVSSFVAAYEQIRALTPEAFFVVGFSRGREAIVSAKDTFPGPDYDVKKGVTMIGAASEPATFLGLFALDANGVPPSAAHLVAPGAKPEEAQLAAIDRDLAPADAARRNILLTTADASRLVPFVAVAQHGLVEKHKTALTAWARVWLESAKKLADDPPTAARQIANAPGAPEPIQLLKLLGDTAPASLVDNARLFGLSGRRALSLEALFQESFRIFRAAGVLATPAPEAAPVSDTIVTALAHNTPSSPKPVTKSPPDSSDKAKTLITLRTPEGKLDEAALQSTTALFADVFERSALRVAVVKAGAVDAAATKKLIDGVESRFDIGPGRLVPAKKAPAKTAAVIEVLAVQ